MPSRRPVTNDNSLFVYKSDSIKRIRKHIKVINEITLRPKKKWNYANW